MVSSQPTPGGPSEKSLAFDKIWQGGLTFLIGLISTATTILAFGVVWYLTIIIMLAGLGWFLTGVGWYYNARQ